MPNLHSPPLKVKSEINTIVQEELVIVPENKPMELVERQLTEPFPKPKPYIETKAEVKKDFEVSINPIHFIVGIPLILQQIIGLQFAY